MAKETHAHKYLRVKMGKDYVVYKCTLTGCPRFIRPELAIGNRAICWRCNHEFTMTQRSITFKKPHCQECTNFRDPVKAAKKKKLTVEPTEAEMLVANVMKGLAGGKI